MKSGFGRRVLVGLGLVTAFALRAQDAVIGPVQANPGAAPVDELPRLREPAEIEVPPEWKDFETPQFVFLQVGVSEDGAAGGIIHGPRTNSIRSQFGALWISRSRAVSLSLPGFPTRTGFVPTDPDPQFHPARVDGRAVATTVLLPIIFNPASASKRGPDATARVLAAQPAVFTPLESSHWPKFGDESPYVWVLLKLSAAGVLENARIERAEAAPLRANVMEALRTWKFAPARKEHVPVASQLRVPVPLTRSYDAAGARPVRAAGTAARPATPGLRFSLDESVRIKPQPDASFGVLSAPFPKTADAMKSIGLFGSSKAVLVVGTDGTVSGFKWTETPRASKEERAAAEATLKTWRFTPPEVGGKPTPVRVAIRYSGSSSSVGAPKLEENPRCIRTVDPIVPDSMRRQIELQSTGSRVSSDIPLSTRLGSGSSFSSANFASMSSTRSHPARAREEIYLRDRVKFTVRIDERGHPTEFQLNSVEVAQYVPIGLVAARQRRYTPGTHAGKPQAVKIPETVSLPGRVAVRDLNWLRWAHPDDPARPDGAPVLKRLALPVQPDGLERGEAEAEIAIDERGAVHGVTLLAASAPEFGLALCAALEACEFEPARRGGKPVSCVMRRKEIFGIKQPDADDPTLVYRPELQKGDSLVANEKLDRAPTPMIERAAVFPIAAREQATTGDAELDVRIDSTGRVGELRVVSATDPSFGHAAIQAVSCWAFSVPTQRGKPVATRQRVAVRFTR